MVGTEKSTTKKAIMGGETSWTTEARSTSSNLHLRMSIVSTQSHSCDYRFSHTYRLTELRRIVFGPIETFKFKLRQAKG